MHLKRFFRLSGTTLLLFHGVLLGCGGSSSTSGGVTDYVSQIAAVLGGTGRATLRSGSLPTGGTSTVNAALSGVVVRGGSTLVTVTPSGGNAVVIGIAGVTSNYWELTNLTGNSLLAVNFAQNPPQSTFNLQVAAGNGTSYGTPQSVPVQPLAGVGGTSDVQVSLTWDAENDLDLHVVEPPIPPATTGVEIYWGRRTSAVGGTLDVDSNANCNIDHPPKRVENVTWPTGHAPHGTYTVRVDYFKNCPPASLINNYVVSSFIVGQPPQTMYINRFLGTGGAEGPDQGGAGAGRTVFTFQY